MGVLPSKRSPPDGLLRRPVRRNRAACRQLQRGTENVFFSSPNPRRLAGRRLRPELRVASRRPRLSRQRRSPARKAAASEVKLQYKRYGTQVRTGIRRRTAAASRSGLRRASGRVFSSASLRAAQREGAAYTAEHARPFASYAPRRLRRAFPPDSAASRYRPGSHLQTHQADRHPCVASRRPQPAPEAGRVVPARHNDRPDLQQKCIGDGTDRTAASLRQASRSGKGRAAPFSSGQGRGVSARRYSEKSTKSLALQGFWCGGGGGRAPPPGGGGPPGERRYCSIGGTANGQRRVSAARKGGNRRLF